MCFFLLGIIGYLLGILSLCIIFHLFTDCKLVCDDPNGTTGSSLVVNLISSNTCPEDKFDCGDPDGPYCISHSLVCDGTLDCANGWDENGENCSNMIRPGP